MMNSTSNNHHDENDLVAVQLNDDDDVEGDTSDDDTSSDEDENDVESSSNSTIKKKKKNKPNSKKIGLQVSTGDADKNEQQKKTNHRKGIYTVLILFVGLMIMAVSIWGGIYYSAACEDADNNNQDQANVIATTTASSTGSSSTITNETNGIIEKVKDEKSSTPTTISSSSNDPTDTTDTTTTKVTVDKKDTRKPISKDGELGQLIELVNYNEEVDENTNVNKDKDNVTSSWPELVGMTGEEAKIQLETTYGEGTYDIYILNENDPTTRDYRLNRIRIFVNEETMKVTVTPRIG